MCSCARVLGVPNKTITKIAMHLEEQKSSKTLWNIIRLFMNLKYKYEFGFLNMFEKLITDKKIVPRKFFPHIGSWYFSY